MKEFQQLIGQPTSHPPTGLPALIWLSYSTIHDFKPYWETYLDPRLTEHHYNFKPATLNMPTQVSNFKKNAVYSNTHPLPLSAAAMLVQVTRMRRNRK